MRLRLSLLLTLLALAWAGPAWSQQVKDPADVLPANVLASIELRQPGALAREIAALFKGTFLEDVPSSLARVRRGNAPVRVGPQELFLLTLTAPEMVREAGRIRGVAVAFTGLNAKHKEPEFLLVVLPGDSNLPGLFTRLFLTSYSAGSSSAAPRRGVFTEQRGGFEPVDTVEGVKIYRMVYRITTYPAARPGAPAEAPKVTREVRESEPAVAMMPGALLIGTPAVVKDAIRRIKGKAETPSLGSVKAYQEARRQLGDEPGLFVFVNPSRVFNAIEKVAGADNPHVEVLQKLVNPKAFRSVAGSVGLKEGNLTYRARYTLDPNEKSPLLEVLPNRPVSTALLHAAPRNAMLFAAISNDRGAKRWEQLLELADTISRTAHPDAPAPSRKVAELEEALKIKIGKDVIGRIADIALVVGDLSKVNEAAAPTPFVPPAAVIVRATGEDDAKALIEAVLPKLVAASTGQEAGEPTKKEIGGQTIYELPARGKGSVCYGLQGETIILGADAKLVAAWLKNSADRSGLLADRKVAAEVKKLDEPVALAVMKPMMGMAFFFLSEKRAKPAAPPPSVSPLPDRPKPEGPLPPRRPQQKPTVASEANASRAQPGLPKILETIAKDNLLVVGVMRKPDHVQVEARYIGLRKLVPALIDLMILEKTRIHPPATGIGNEAVPMNEPVRREKPSQSSPEAPPEPPAPPKKPSR